MAPSGRTRTRAKPKPKPKPKPTRKPRITTHCKKRLSKPLNVQETSVMEDLPSCSSTTTSLKIDECDFEGNVDDGDHHIPTSACSTPKAQKFRIPEIVTCPPAPKKQRMVSNCSLQRRPIAFFAPPDIELFFFYALHDISV